MQSGRADLLEAGDEAPLITWPGLIPLVLGKSFTRSFVASHRSHLLASRCRFLAFTSYVFSQPSAVTKLGLCVLLQVSACNHSIWLRKKILEPDTGVETSDHGECFNTA